jgi:class 3 adenylate cyclase
MEITNAIVLFTDIRGFTKWSEGIEAFQYIDVFINKFYNILNEQFPPEIFYLKKLGDGAMVVKVIETDVTSESVVDMLTENLDKIRHVEANFNDLCNDFFELYGYRTELRLGWGLVRGVVKKLNDDFIGANINKCARLCGIARPFGIVIEKDDFPTLPRDSTYNFSQQTRKLEGIVGDVNVWVTDEIATQFIPREKMREAPEIHVAGLCIKIEKGNIMALIARRETNRKLFPGLYEGCGGQLAYSESLSDGVKRHFRLEMGIDVDVIETIHNFYEIKESNEPLIPGIKFLCIYSAGSPESKNHSEIRWVSEEELKLIPTEEFIPGLKADFIHFIELYRNQILLQ